MKPGDDRMFNDPRRGKQAVRDQREKKGSLKKNASFDARRQISKFAVLGRKQARSARVNQGAARNKAINMAEMAESQRTVKNLFQDDRFGEDDEEMSVEDKMLHRFQKERATRANRFDLADDDEDLQLTHMGQSLGDDKFDFGGSFGSDDDEDEDFFTDKVVNDAHFGGGADEPGAADPEKRTRQEIMNEVIAKSKKFKAERQKNKDEDTKIVDELDHDWKDLYFMLNQRSEAVSNDEWEREQAKKQWDNAGSAIQGAMPVKELEAGQKRIAFDFDARVRTLERESQKAAPTQRMKSEEEIALAESVRLKNLEVGRLQRMNGEVAELERETAALDTNRRRTDDDLEDDWEADPEFAQSFSANARLQRATKLSKGEDEEDEEDEDEEEEDNNDADLANDGVDDQGRVLAKHRRAAAVALVDNSQADKLAKGYNQEQPLESGSELPYTFDVPQSATRYELLISQLTEKEEVVVIKRVLVCNSLKADVRNRTKMEGFVEILIERLQSAAQASPARMRIVDTTVQALFALAPLMPDVVAKAFVVRINAIGEAMTHSSKPQGRQECCWPSLGELCMLQAVSSLFPVTDWRHPVVTPALLVLSRCLYHGRRTNNAEATAEDAVAGCLAATVMHSLVAPSHRFCPEAVDYLISFLRHCLAAESCIDLKKCSKKLSPQPMSFQPDMKQYQHQLNLVATVYRLLRQYLVLYSNLEAAAEICAPVEGLLEAGAVCESLQAVHNALNDRVKSISSQPTRRPIQWQPKKLAQIKMFNPRFDEDYNMDRSSDPVKERAEANKLKKRVNRDLKHTMRELQQGAALVAQARDKKQQEKIDIRKTKMNKHKGELEAQQHNFNHPTMGIGEKSKRNRKRKNG